MMTRCIQLRVAMATGRERPRSLSWQGAGESLFALSMRVSFQSGLPWPMLWRKKNCSINPEVAACDRLSRTHLTFWFSFSDHRCQQNFGGRWFKNPHYLVRVLSNIRVWGVMCTRYFAMVLSFGVGVLTFLCSGWFGMLRQNKAICTSDGIFLNILWACSLDSASCVNRKEVGSCLDDIAATAKCVCGFEWANSCHGYPQLTSCSGPRCMREHLARVCCLTVWRSLRNQLRRSEKALLWRCRGTTLLA